MLMLLGLIAGLVAGSFVAALTVRWPQGRSIVHGRSACDACGKTLGPLELVPVISFVALRGRCRHCGAAIAGRNLAIEVAGGVIGAAAMLAQPGISGVFGAVFGWWLLTLAVLDAEHFWLPDSLTISLIGTGILAGSWAAPELLMRLAGAVTGYLVLAVIAQLYKSLRGHAGMGGGDPKLLAAIGAWLGPWLLAPVMAAAAMLGLVLVGVDALRGRPVTATTRVPFGALLAGAAWVMWLVKPLWEGLLP
ncbi:A24 family peptidase [Sandarakinorhabdus sp.]|uniref:prepilin peptidase n=1 Tax=Sandarakinorhabdus sp. TaxID=1916663 RepID=UPI00286E268E|nr:A24 family peptidase [Sandarakinorhabdus sp.]